MGGVNPQGEFPCRLFVHQILNNSLTRDPLDPNEPEEVGWRCSHVV